MNSQPPRWPTAIRHVPQMPRTPHILGFVFWRDALLWKAEAGEGGCTPERFFTSSSKTRSPRQPHVVPQNLDSIRNQRPRGGVKFEFMR